MKRGINVHSVRSLSCENMLKKPGTLAHTRLGNVGCGQYTLLLNRIFYSIWRILQHTKFYPNLNMHEKR